MKAWKRGLSPDRREKGRRKRRTSTDVRRVRRRISEKTVLFGFRYGVQSSLEQELFGSRRKQLPFSFAEAEKRVTALRRRSR